VIVSKGLLWELVTINCTDTSEEYSLPPRSGREGGGGGPKMKKLKSKI